MKNESIQIRPFYLFIGHPWQAYGGRLKATKEKEVEIRRSPSKVDLLASVKKKKRGTL